MKEKSKLKEYISKKHQEANRAEKLISMASRWVRFNRDPKYERLVFNNEEKGIVRGVIDDVLMFSAKLENGLDNEFGSGSSPGKYAYVGDILQSMVQYGNPLAEQILEFRKTGESASSNIFSWNKLSGNRGIVESMILRTMTESEYRGLINGEIPIGAINHGWPRYRDIEEVYLKSQNDYSESKTA